MVNARAILGARSDVYKQKYNMVALIVKKKLLYKKSLVAQPIVNINNQKNTTTARHTKAS